MTWHLKIPSTFRFSRQSASNISTHFLKHQVCLSASFEPLVKCFHSPGKNKQNINHRCHSMHGHLGPRRPGGAGRLWLTSSLGSWRNGNKAQICWSLGDIARLFHGIWWCVIFLTIIIWVWLKLSCYFGNVWYLHLLFRYIPKWGQWFCAFRLQYIPFLRAPKELWAHPENDWQVEQTD